MAKKYSYDLHGHSFRGQYLGGYKTVAKAEAAAELWATAIEATGCEVFGISSEYYEDDDTGQTLAQAIVIYDANR